MCRSLATGSKMWGTALCHAAVAKVETLHLHMLPWSLLTLYVVYNAPGCMLAHCKSLHASGLLIDGT